VVTPRPRGGAPHRDDMHVISTGHPSRARRRRTGPPRGGRDFRSPPARAPGDAKGPQKSAGVKGGHPAPARRRPVEPCLHQLALRSPPARAETPTLSGRFLPLRLATSSPARAETTKENTGNGKIFQVTPRARGGAGRHLRGPELLGITPRAHGDASTRETPADPWYGHPARARRRVTP